MAKRSFLSLAALGSLLAATGCLRAGRSAQDPASALKDSGRNSGLEPANNDAMLSLLYEVQVRAANACRSDIGSPAQRQACAAKVAPEVIYQAKSSAGGYDCETDQQFKDVMGDLNKIRLGTFEDMLQDTDDYRVGITLRYIKERVGANTIWVMPVFPNNNREKIPARCDNLGSPYAVRDYMHTAGSLSHVCIVAKTDEFHATDGDEAPCWGDVSFDKLLAEAKQRGLRIMMDVAFNHFGHDYRYYDYASFMPTRDRIAKNEDLDDLWDFDATFEPGLVNPTVVDSVAKLEAAASQDATLKAAYTSVAQRCPAIKGDTLVRAVGMYRNMLEWERGQFQCDMPMYLEQQAPGFYAGAGGAGNKHPSHFLGDNFSNSWSDVKFLYHQQMHASDDRGDYYQTFVRNREYFFRILNYWVAKGVQGFRLDHASDGDSGLAADEWRYLIRKVNYYDWVRKGKPSDRHNPIYMAEDFSDNQGDLAKVFDAMTEGYLFAMRQINPKDTPEVQGVIEGGKRFPDRLMVMRALEDHDEPRLFDGTGFDEWTGAGFWGIGLTTRGMPAMLMGQEFGERERLSFRRSDFLRGRFEGDPGFSSDGPALIDFYGQMIKARFDARNHALESGNYIYLPLKNGQANDPKLFAEMKWWGSDVLFAFHNLWKQGTVTQTFYIPPETAAAAGVDGGRQYRLMNVLSGKQEGDCLSGDELKTNFYVKLAESERLQWLRLELCR